MAKAEAAATEAVGAEAEAEAVVAEVASNYYFFLKISHSAS